MKRYLETEVEIEATPEQVWTVLLDFESYPEWNPFIPELSGIPRVGECLQELVRLPDGKEVRFSPLILELEAPFRMVWRGDIAGGWLFRGVHSILLEPLRDGTRTRFVQTEQYSGLMLPFINMELNRTGYNQMNQALKVRVEGIG